MRLSRIGALIHIDPALARAEILAAIDAAKGSRTHAAEAMGAPLRTLHNWIQALGLGHDIDALCTRKGYHVQPGPERKVERGHARTAIARKKVANRPTAREST
jgi:hypothetical protein